MNSMPLCPTCFNPAGQPYRRLCCTTGVIIEGCIDAFHNAAVHCLSIDDIAWHLRPEAEVLRKAGAEMRQKVRHGQG